jgi:hypothetical protein
MGAQVVITSEFCFAIYFLAGIFFFIWSQQFAPRSKAAFDNCFHYSRVTWAIFVLIAVAIWPIIALRMMYRFTFPTRDAKDEKSDR